MLQKAASYKTREATFMYNVLSSMISVGVSIVQVKVTVVHSVGMKLGEATTGWNVLWQMYGLRYIH